MEIMKTRELALGLVIGVGLAATTTAIARSVIDARSGPAVAISVATSADGTIVYVANPNGFFKSINGGETWQSMPVE
jgi:hypothetical protein